MILTNKGFLFYDQNFGNTTLVLMFQSSELSKNDKNNTTSHYFEVWSSSLYSL